MNLLSRKSLHQALARATVKIIVGGHFKGTGFFITADGYILTAHHVIGAVPLTLTVQTFAGEHLMAQVDNAKSLPEQDLAVLKVVTRPIQCVPLGVISSQQVTDTVLSVGYPLGDRPDNPHLGFYEGTIFRLREDGKIETDAVRGQGQSGGLLYHEASHRVIGVAVEGYKPERMIAGLAQRLDSLFLQWSELPSLTASVARHWDSNRQWWRYRWLLVILIVIGLLGFVWFISSDSDQPRNSTSGPCSSINETVENVSINCTFGTSK